MNDLPATFRPFPQHASMHAVFSTQDSDLRRTCSVGHFDRGRLLAVRRLSFTQIVRGSGRIKAEFRRPVSASKSSDVGSKREFSGVPQNGRGSL